MSNPDDRCDTDRLLGVLALGLPCHDPRDFVGYSLSGIQAQLEMLVSWLEGAEDERGKIAHTVAMDLLARMVAFDEVLTEHMDVDYKAELKRRWLGDG